MKIIFQIDGGIGKSIAATAVCKAIKQQYPNDDLIVLTGYPQVFLCNPHVKAYSLNELRYFYEQYIAGQDIKIMAHNPYLETSFIKRDGHLLKVWCEMFGITYNGEQPELYLNSREQAFFTNVLGSSQKPILVMQTNGGALGQQNKYSWARDLPLGTAQRIVYALANDFHIVHIRREDQPALQGTTPIHSDNFRMLAVLISISQQRLFIDSFAQHAAAALGLPSVVCWIANTPSQFGYNIHTNILANLPTVKPELRHSIYSQYNISGDPLEFPYNNEEEIFDIDKIIQALLVPPIQSKQCTSLPSLAIENHDSKDNKKQKKEKFETA